MCSMRITCDRFVPSSRIFAFSAVSIFSDCCAPTPVTSESAMTPTVVLRNDMGRILLTPGVRVGSEWGLTPCSERIGGSVSGLFLGGGGRLMVLVKGSEWGQTPF